MPPLVVGQKYGINNDILYLEKLEDGEGLFLCPDCKQTFIWPRKGIRRKKACTQCSYNRLLKVHAGDVFGRLTVLEVLPEKDKDNRRLCLVQCSCEDKTILKVSTHHLLSGNTKSCGCLQREWVIAKNKAGSLNITGQKYGLLTAVKDTGISSSNGHIWLFDCDCGNKNIPIRLGDVRRQTRVGTLSCGCLKQSKGEYLIESSLKSLNIGYYKEYSFSDCRNPKTGALLRFDFYLPTFNVCIEFDGYQHFHQNEFDSSYWWGSVNLQEIRYRDSIKNKYCLEHEIVLYRISYNDITKIDDSYILGLLEGDKI